VTPCCLVEVYDICDHEENGLLGCDDVKFGEIPTFRRNISPPISELEEWTKQETSSRQYVPPKRQLPSNYTASQPQVGAIGILKLT
jgi:hypothetical protein